jgi:hypothetical protein
VTRWVTPGSGQAGRRVGRQAGSQAGKLALRAVAEFLVTVGSY